jgi:outer membrane receptor protein involved in Fe transport
MIILVYFLIKAYTFVKKQKLMRRLFFFIIILFNLNLFSQVIPDSLRIDWKDYWLVEGRAYLHLSQGAQANWAKGGDNIFSSLIKARVSAKYKKERQIWDNALKWNYGFLFVGVPEDQAKGIEYRTSDDNIELNSSYGYKASGDFYYNALFNFKTQFFPGYKYPNDSVKVSNFLSPAYIVFSLGINYKPNEHFKVMLSPVTFKTTIVVRESEVDETKFGLKK